MPELHEIQFSSVIFIKIDDTRVPFWNRAKKSMQVLSDKQETRQCLVIAPFQGPSKTWHNKLS